MYAITRTETGKTVLISRSMAANNNPVRNTIQKLATDLNVLSIAVVVVFTWAIVSNI